MSAKKSSTTAAVSSAAEIISYNEDILSEILIRLPAKSLIRFKSVAKNWQSLISDVSFCLLHTRRHRSPQTSFLLRPPGSHCFHFNPISKNLVPFNFNFDRFKIRQSCNGLLLLEIGSGYTNRVYYVYNPTTGESRNLLLPSNENADFRCLFLAFDPLKSPHYKAVCVRDSKTTYFVYYIEIYDSETHEWKRDDKAYEMRPHTFPPGRNWVYSRNFTCSLWSEGGLFCFDIEKLMFRGPFFVDFGEDPQLNVPCIIESFGHVHVISLDFYDLVMVREITEKNGEWSFKILFHFDMKKAATCLGLIRGDRVEEISLVFYIPAGKIMAYRFHERRIEELLDLSTNKFYVNGCFQFGYNSSCTQFVESLAPV